MARFLPRGLWVLGALLAPALPALDLSPAVKDAVRLELAGRLDEALGVYTQALATSETLAQDEGVKRAETAYVLEKAASLAIDLGRGDDAYDLSARLLTSKVAGAAEAGTVVRMRILRLQGQSSAALTLASQFRAGAKTAPGAAFLSEELRCRTAAGLSVAAVKAALGRSGGPGAWTVQGPWVPLASPAEAWGLNFQPSVRIQVGAFSDWGRALTLVDMLREKGWVPLTEVKTQSSGAKVHLVLVLSRQPEADRARLEAEGLTALP